MSYNGAGVFSIGTDGYPIAYDTVADETVVNSIFDELGDGITNAICKDGQSVIAQNIPFNAKKITNLGAATALKDALNGLTSITNYFNYATSIGGTANAIELGTVAGAVDLSLTQGLQIWFKPTAPNTTAVTINLHSLGAKDLTKAGTIALAPGDLQTNSIACIVYDGTRFQLVTPYYAEGSWTPSVGGTATYTTQVGRWTKIGREVHITAVLTINTIGTGSTSVISGLPYTALNLVNQSVSVSDFASLATNVVWIGARVDINATTITMRNLTAAGASATSSALFGNSASVTISGTYMI